MTVWTHGTWTIREGREGEFVAGWEALARRVAAELEILDKPTLLRDRERPNVFVSFGSWSSAEAVDAFRSSDAFREALLSMEDIVESLEPRTLDEISRGG
jgi:heme-degrading monooxygenase HmoA